MTKITRFPAVLARRLMQKLGILQLKTEFAEVFKNPQRIPAALILARALLLLIASIPQTCAAASGSRVTFNDEGIALVDGKPFFPIGVFTYSLDPTVLAELREVQCNTVLHGFNPDQLNLLHAH